jgi:hypothetical protein
MSLYNAEAAALEQWHTHTRRVEERRVLFLFLFFAFGFLCLDT